MRAQRINGNQLAEQIRESLKAEVTELKEKGITPGLAVVLVGDDPASRSYVTAKERDCEKVGIYSRDIRLAEETTQKQLVKLIIELNHDQNIHGILVQLPLPRQIDEQAIIETIVPEKDVDGFHPVNVGKMVLEQDCYLPCTPHGILKMIESVNVKTEGREIVIVGRSNIVGKPIANLLMQKRNPGNATITVCHTRTVNLAEKTKKADILIAAAGRAEMITGNMIKPGAVIIDVGVNRVEDKQASKGYCLKGDVNFEEAEKIASYITPVPGGVGPMTRTMLLVNTVKSARKKSH